MLFKSLQGFNKQEGASSMRGLAAQMAARAYGFTHSNQSAANI